MKKCFFFLAYIVVCTPLLLAQSDKRAEVFIGYSNLQGEGIPDRNDPSNTFSNNFFERRKGLHGGTASITGFFNRGFGLTGDFSFHRTEDSTDLTTGRDVIDTRVTYFMGGPTLKARNNSRFEPFARVLAGGANTRFEVSSTRTVAGGTVRSSFDANSTDFAMAVGGGLDLRLGDRFSLRVFQVDYAPVFLRDRSVNVLGGAGAIQTLRLEGQRQDNVRFSVGLVF